MFSPEMNYLVALEQHRDRLRAIEHDQLLQIVGVQTGRAWPKTLCGWLGRRLQVVGAKLEQFGEPPCPQRALKF